VILPSSSAPEKPFVGHIISWLAAFNEAGVLLSWKMVVVEQPAPV